MVRIHDLPHMRPAFYRFCHCARYLHGMNTPHNVHIVYTVCICTRHAWFAHYISVHSAYNILQALCINTCMFSVMCVYANTVYVDHISSTQYTFQLMCALWHTAYGVNVKFAYTVQPVYRLCTVSYCIQWTYSTACKLCTNLHCALPTYTVHFLFIRILRQCAPAQSSLQTLCTLHSSTYAQEPNEMV